MGKVHFAPLPLHNVVRNVQLIDAIMNLSNNKYSLERWRNWEKASYEVDVYENRLEVLSSIHKDCSEVWDWEAIRTEEQPTEPVNSHRHEDVAERN